MRLLRRKQKEKAETMGKRSNNSENDGLSPRIWSFLRTRGHNVSSKAAAAASASPKISMLGPSSGDCAATTVTEGTTSLSMLPSLSSHLALSLQPGQSTDSLMTNRCSTSDVPQESALPPSPLTESFDDPCGLILTPNQREELGCLLVDFQFLCQAHVNCTDKPILCVEISSPADRNRCREIFSHPQLVEAAALCFTTVAPPPRNYSDELSHRNHPLVRFICAKTQRGLMPSIQSIDISLKTVVSGMVGALKATKKTVPVFFNMLHEEVSGDQRIAVLGVVDAAHAEVELAGLEGVLNTSVGSIEKFSVVQVTYDHCRLCFGGLVRFVFQHIGGSYRIYYKTNEECKAAQTEIARYGKEEICTTHRFQDVIQYDIDPKRAMRKTPLRFVPLTGLQATRCNRLVASGSFDQAVHLLSPIQGGVLMQAMRNQKGRHEVVGVPLSIAWQSVYTHSHPSRVKIDEYKHNEYIEELYGTVVDDSDMHARFL